MTYNLTFKGVIFEQPACLHVLFFQQSKHTRLFWQLFNICRWGNTPLDEGRMCGNKNLIKMLENAKSAQLSEFPELHQEITGKFSSC